MYNAEIKEVFLRDTTRTEASRNARVRTFNLFQKYEEDRGSDLCTFSAKEIQSILDGFSFGMRARSNDNNIITIRSYIKWCLSRKIDGASSDGLNITNSNIEKIRRHTVKNPLHLKKFLDDVFTEQDGTIFDPIKGFFWVAFGGCKEEDTMYLTKNDVDLRNGIINGKSWQSIIYKEGYETIRQCVEATEFLYFNSQYINKGDILRPRVPGDCIFRGVRGAGTPSLDVFRSNISRRVKEALAEGKTDLNLSYYRVMMSGVFYRMRELEVAEVLTDSHFEALANMHLRKKQESHGNVYYDRHIDQKRDDPHITRQDRNMFLRKVNDYKTDYENWKMTIF